MAVFIGDATNMPTEYYKNHHEELERIAAQYEKMPGIHYQVRAQEIRNLLLQEKVKDE